MGDIETDAEEGAQRPVTITQDILERDGYQCAYCGKRAVQADHVIPRTVRARLARCESKLDPLLLGLVAACRDCNEGKGTRPLIPASWEDRLDELNALHIGVFRVWRGDAAMLRTTTR